MKAILFLVPHPIDCSDYRYRAQQFVPYLESAGYRCVIWPFSTSGLYAALQSKGQLATKVLHMLFCTMRRILEIATVSRFDLVVINREVFPFFAPLAEKLVLRSNARVVFAFDDAIHVGHHDISQFNHAWLYKFKYGNGIEEILRRSIHVVAGNRILADYARQFNAHVSVVPTVVDCSLYVPRQPRKNGTEPITVGWIGSRSTFHHLFDIEPALKRLAEANPGKVCFRAFGYSKGHLDLPDFESLPFRLDGEVEYLGSIDIGIMPLPDTEWTRGKCAFKAIQYMAMGIPTVASPVGITGDIVRHDVNGLLATSIDDWFNSLNRLVNDGELRRRLGLRGRRTIQDSYSLQAWGPRIASLFDQLSVIQTKPHAGHGAVLDSWTAHGRTGSGDD
jgi:glycosyltransferase involved in cell wall biosynthesis